MRYPFYSFTLIQKELCSIFTMANPKLLLTWCFCCPFYWFLICGCRLKIFNTDENKLLIWTSWDCCYNSVGQIVRTQSIPPHYLRWKIELLVHWMNTSLWNRSLLMAGYKQESVGAHLKWGFFSAVDSRFSLAHTELEQVEFLKDLFTENELEATWNF